MRRSGIATGIVLALCAHAQAQSVMFGKRLIGKGDPMSIVRDVAGTPDQVDRIEGDNSTPAMEIWTYRRDDREITLWVVSGKIVKTQEKTITPPTGGGPNTVVTAG